MRIDRTGFLRGLVLYILIQFLMGAIFSVIQLLNPGKRLPEILPPAVLAVVLGITIIISIIIFIEFVLICVRRLHDMGFTWLPILLMLVPMLNLLVVLYLLVMPGEERTNRYGPIPASRSWRTIFGYAKIRS